MLISQLDLCFDFDDQLCCIDKDSRKRYVSHSVGVLC